MKPTNFTILFLLANVFVFTVGCKNTQKGNKILFEEYNKVVKEYADITRQQAPAEETDPIMWDQLCEDWGEVPTETIQYGGKRAMNYLEMTKFMRGYWR